MKKIYTFIPLKTEHKKYWKVHHRIMNSSI